ncbi:MAG: pilus assembly protein [Planctomycetia bacterium]|nr:pilus assembly protein [Planctomycetia bacterium]
MIRKMRFDRSRRGIAATEMALVAPLLLTILLGIWEVARVVMVSNLLQNTSRETARLAASGAFFASNNRTNKDGVALVLPLPSSNDNYEVQKRAITFLQMSGINTNAATVTVSNMGTSSSAKAWSYTWVQGGSSSGVGYDPATCADQLDVIQVTVTLPYSNVSLVPSNMFFQSNTILRSTVQWASMRDIPLVVTGTIPSKPYLPTDPLP